MARYRIVQREGLYYVQKRKLFLWFYENKINFAHKRFAFKYDGDGFIGFPIFKDSKDYLNEIVNSKTKIVYELET